MIIELERCNKVMDLGVIADSKLSFTDHITVKVDKAYSILGILKRNFQHVDTDAFVLLYKALVRSHLEYANTVWSPCKHYLIEEVEKVQKRATELVHECKHLSYAEGLKYLKLPTLKYHWHRADMIETYKITHGLYDTAVVPNLMTSQVSHTRGNVYRQYVDKCKVMHVGNRDDGSTYYMEGSELTKVSCEKDLGVWISGDMKFSKQCIYACNKATRVLGMIKRTIRYKDTRVMMSLYLLGLMLKTVSAWNPHYIKDKKLIEEVKRFTDD